MDIYFGLFILFFPLISFAVCVLFDGFDKTINDLSKWMFTEH